jgi:membrane peptidoglycan carboxypeptidase
MIGARLRAHAHLPFPPASPGFHVDAQAEDSELYSILARGGVYPVYRQKDQAGLTITDRDGRSLLAAAQPRRIYSTYSAIPPLVVNTLLFIETRTAWICPPVQPSINQRSKASRAFSNGSRIQYKRKPLGSRTTSFSRVYSFTLYEHSSGVNLLRVQADNLNQPLNINPGTKLELGSTPKLRTLITYLEIIAAGDRKGPQSESNIGSCPSAQILGQSKARHFSRPAPSRIR